MNKSNLLKPGDLCCFKQDLIFPGHCSIITLFSAPFGPEPKAEIKLNRNILFVVIAAKLAARRKSDYLLFSPPYLGWIDSRSLKKI